MRSNISYRPYANVDYEKIYKKVVEMDPSMEEFIWMKNTVRNL